MDFTQTQVNDIVAEAKQAAYEAGQKYYNEVLGGQDRYACGFASVKIRGIKGNTKLGRALKAAGVTQSYDKSFEIWNPSGLRCQNVDTKEIGAEAAAAVLRNYGFKAYSWSRLD